MKTRSRCIHMTQPWADKREGEKIKNWRRKTEGVRSVAIATAASIGFQGRESEKRQSRGRERRRTFTALPLSHCMKVGQQTHTRTFTHTHRITGIHQTALFYPTVCGDQGLGEAALWRNLVGLSGHMKQSRGVKTNNVFNRDFLCLWDMHRQ